MTGKWKDKESIINSRRDKVEYVKSRFSDEEIEKANNTNIMDYVNSLNLETARAGRTIKIKGYGGLYINPSENTWYCFSRNKGGGPIQLVSFLENKTWVEAMKTLLGRNYEQKPVCFNNRKVPKHNTKDEIKELILPKKNKTFNHVIAYLIKTRGIDKEFVYKCIQNKTLYEDERRNCVFVGYDNDGIPRYAGLRGTNTSKTFKGEVPNSNKSYSFNIPGTTNKLYIFESPIELMSYLTLQKRFKYDLKFNHHTLSLGCLATTALERYLKDNPNIEELNICLNNDKWGIEAANRIEKEYKDKLKISIEYPVLKDFNEDLISIHRNIQKENNEKEIDDEEELYMEI